MFDSAIADTSFDQIFVLRWTRVEDQPNVADRERLSASVSAGGEVGEYSWSRSKFKDLSECLVKIGQKDQLAFRAILIISHRD